PSLKNGETAAQYSVVAPCGLLTYGKYAPHTVLTTPCLACVLLRFTNGVYTSQYFVRLTFSLAHVLLVRSRREIRAFRVLLVSSPLRWAD
ncbi:MAG: hypothetical protein IIX02_04895, partial [Clostridia bacterium]|nr:hypothetical protein [Clostridia bacterium]